MHIACMKKHMYCMYTPKGYVMEVSLAQVSCILIYVYVALPTPVGAWSMALGLRQCIEYYYYCMYTPDVCGVFVVEHQQRDSPSDKVDRGMEACVTRFTCSHIITI